MAASLGGAASAATFEDFQAMCVKTNADPQAALAAADAAGWMPLPKPMLRQLVAESDGLETAEGRLRSDKAGMRFVMVGRGLFGSLSLRMTLCAVGAMPVDAGAAKQVATWVGLPEVPELTQGGTHGYAFTGEEGAHRQVDPNGPELPGLIATGGVRAVFAETDPKMTMLLLGIPVR